MVARTPTKSSWTEWTPSFEGVARAFRPMRVFVLMMSPRALALASVTMRRTVARTMATAMVGTVMRQAVREARILW